jgi:hypothetical protein
MFFLAAGNSEEGFWVQLLVIVILACAAGFYTLIKSRVKRTRRNTEDAIIETIIESQAPLLHTPKKQSLVNSAVSAPALRNPKGEVGISAVKQPVVKSPAPVRFEFKKPIQKTRDTSGGMEILSREFLVGVVERTSAIEKLDISIRSMCWNELSRRDELFAVSSESLKIYILNERGFFDKAIRREAMVELAGRTENESQPPPPKTISASQKLNSQSHQISA